MDNEQGWKRLGAAVKKRREERDWTQLDVATRGGISIDRIQAIEGARTDRYSPRTFTKIERGLEWELGSCRAILAGGDPTPSKHALTDAGQAEDDLTVKRSTGDEDLDRLIAQAQGDPILLKALLATRDMLDEARRQTAPDAWGDKRDEQTS